MGKNTRRDNDHMFRTLVNLTGNPRACIYTEPLWSIPYYLYIPYASLYMLALGVTKVQIGHIITIGMISQVIFSLLGGIITDKLGRKRATFIFDIISWGIPTFIWAISSSYIYFAIAAFINGIMRVTANSWTCLLVEDAEESKLVSIFSWIHISGLLASFFSPLTGLFVQNFNLIPTIRVIYGISFVSMMAKFIILNIVAKETTIGEKRMIETRHISHINMLKGYIPVIKHILTTKKTLFTVAIMVTLSIVTTINSSFWSVIVTERLLINEKYIGIFVAIKSIVMMFLFLYVIPKINLLRFKRPLFVGFFILMISQSLLIIAPIKTIIPLILSIVLEGMSLSLINPLLDSLQVIMIDQKERARIMAILYTIVILFTSPFGSIAGYLSEVDLRLPFIMNISFIIVGLVIILAQKMKRPKSNLSLDTP